MRETLPRGGHCRHSIAISLPQEQQNSFDHAKKEEARREKLWNIIN